MRNLINDRIVKDQCIKHTKFVCEKLGITSRISLGCLLISRDDISTKFKTHAADNTSYELCKDTLETCLLEW